MTVTLDQKALNSIVKKLESLDDPKVFRVPMTQSVQHLQDQLSQSRPSGRAYPPQTNAFSLLATPGQKRAYWAKVSSGEISQRPGGGYRRSGELGRNWTTEVSANGRTGKVGNDSGYGQYVQGERQQRFHASSGWQTVANIAKVNEQKIIRFFEKAYERALSK